MSIITKRHIITNVSGTDQLFQLPEDYIQGTLWTFVVATSGATSLRANTYFAGGFFQITPPPTSGSSIYCIYDTQVTDTNDPLNFNIDGITLDNIVSIAKVLKDHTETLKSMDTALNNRVSHAEFSKYAEITARKLKALEV